MVRDRAFGTYRIGSDIFPTTCVKKLATCFLSSGDYAFEPHLPMLPIFTVKGKRDGSGFSA